MKRIIIFSAVLGLLAAAMPVFAHHSFAAEYDGSKPVTLTGTLKSIDWRNPHIYYLLDVKDASGKIVTWTLEGYPPNMLVRRPEGWTREKVMAKIGSEATVTGWLARTGGNAAHSRQFTFADGSKMESGPGAGNGGRRPIHRHSSRRRRRVRYRILGLIVVVGAILGGLCLLPSLTIAQQRGDTPAPAAGGQRGARGAGAGRGAAPTGPPPRDSQGRADLSGMWMSGGFGGGQRSDPVPYTPEAQQKVREFQSRQNIDDPMGLCLLVGIPRIYSMPMPFRIIQMPNEVIFLHEAFRGIRIVPTDGRSHPADAEPAYLGDSVGHWEGDTLVIDVTSFNDRTWLGYGATHHTEKLHITERLTRTGPESISYEAEITDPGVFTKPWTVRSGFALRPNERIREYECGENNQEVVKFQELLKKPELFVDPSRLQPRQ